LRSYFGSEKGISFSFRRSTKGGFSARVRIVAAEESGPVFAPIWVAPAEDVIFYSSPGPGEEMSPNKRLWMIRP
jgi:hypothetical protein